jgi:hypothetical protein
MAWRRRAVFALTVGCATANRHSQRPISAALAVAISVASAAAGAAEPKALPVVPVCYNYGCETRVLVSMRSPGWRALQQLFAKPADSPQTERTRIRAAVALMERLMGEQTPIHRDKAKNAAKKLGGQMDCVDESRNTDAYLRLFTQHNYLIWHRVRERVLRMRFIFIQHWGAQIEDLTTGQHYIVDSWYRDSGEPPYLQKTEDWKKARPFPPQDL